MSLAAYSLEALREYRRRKASSAVDTHEPLLTLKDIPPDAPMEEGIVLGCWNGEAFVSWEKWRASQPVEAFRQAHRDTPPAMAPPRKAPSHRVVTGSLFALEGEDGRAG